MEPIVLKNHAHDGTPIQATFLPDQGMNMVSFKKGDIEIIDQSTRNMFENHYAGLGALIGPHFYRKRPESLPVIKDEGLFPHIARVKAKESSDPFSHGIARYAPWKAEVKDNRIKALLSGKDTWNNVPLADLEGQNFKIDFEVELKENGLHLNLAIVSDTDSLMGIHYYYAMHGKGRVISEVQNKIRNQKRELVNIPTEWSFDTQHRLIFDLEQEADFTFRPFPDSLEGLILLETEDYTLRTHYRCPSAENCWQLYHPAGASFVCIEPISAQDPCHPNLSVSSLNIHLEII